MNNARVTNGPGLGTMSAATRKKPRRPNSELEYLTIQAADAKAALAQTSREMGRNLRQSAIAHPVLAVGAAAVGGALLGRVLVSRAGNVGDVAAKSNSADDSTSFISEIVSDAIKPLIPNLISAVLAMFQVQESEGESQTH